VWLLPWLEVSCTPHAERFLVVLMKSLAAQRLRFFTAQVLPVHDETQPCYWSGNHDDHDAPGRSPQTMDSQLLGKGGGPLFSHFKTACCAFICFGAVVCQGRGKGLQGALLDLVLSNLFKSLSCLSGSKAQQRAWRRKWQSILTPVSPEAVPLLITYYPASLCVLLAVLPVHRFACRTLCIVLLSVLPMHRFAFSTSYVVLLAVLPNHRIPCQQHQGLSLYGKRSAVMM